jgi:hypothetical protein
MSRASKERERKARRAAYRDAIRLGKVEARLREGFTDTYSQVYGAASEADRRQEMRSRAHHNGKDSAVHEAGHAFAAWVQGLGISYMKMNDRDSLHYDVDLGDLDAVTASSETLTPEEAKSGRSSLQGTAEGYVIGCRHAFVTLAGALAQNMYLSEEAPVTLTEHIWDAGSRFHFFSGLDENACSEVVGRLARVVIDTFEDERVKDVTFALASIRWERRYLSGEEVWNIISAAWKKANENK